MKKIGFLLCWAFLLTGAYAQLADAKTVQVKIGKPVNLKSFGGGNFEITIAGTDMNYINIATIDYDHVVPNQVGWNSLGMMTNAGVSYAQEQKQIEKKDRVPVSGTVSPAYLICQKDDLKVYFFDTLNNRMNECTLLIVAPKKGTKE